MNTNSQRLSFARFFAKNLLFTACLLGLFTLAANANPPTTPVRNQMLFDFDWRFHLGDLPKAVEGAFDDSEWRELNLPHDWSVEFPFDKSHASATGFLPGGIGWYRKTFDVPAEWEGREVSIEFDGVYRNSEVWINGQKLGGRPSGYLPFNFRLTPHLQYGKESTIAVRVARENVADSRWYPGTGIYRHTWLTVADPLHVDRWGVFVTTPRVTDKRADVTTSMTLENLNDQESTFRIESEIISPAGKVLGNQSTTGKIVSGEKKTLAHWHVVDSPERWSVDSPNLYTMVTRVYQAGKLIDEVQTPFGIRQFYFDADKGFFLNGKSMKIKGVCLHHDGGVVGSAVPDKTLLRRLRLVKELGANAVRCSHNPMAKEFYDYCDQIGLLVMDEAFDEWELGKRKWIKGRNKGRAGRAGANDHFDEWAVQDVEDMVRRNRNHPSIILWSIGNEIDYPGDPYAHPEFFDPAAPPVDEGSPSATRLAVVAPKLIAAVKRQDPTRPVTMALSNMPAANGIGLASMLDVAGYNYQEKFYQQDHIDFPGRMIYGSENGKGMRSWLAVAGNDFISAQFLWVGFDFLGEADEWPNHGSRWGVFDSRGFRKLESQQYQLFWSKQSEDNEPLVQISVMPRRVRGQPPQRSPLMAYPRTWEGKVGERQSLLVFSNCDRVELELNGKPIEVNPPRGEERQRRRGRFQAGPVENTDLRMDLASLPFESGQLVAKAYRGDELVATDTLVTPEPAVRLELVSDMEELLADGQDVAHVEVRFVDANGNLVPMSHKAVTCRVEGAGRLLGVDNGDMNDPTALQNPTKSTHDGRLLVIVQSSRVEGVVILHVEAEGFPAVTLRLPSRSSFEH